MNYNQGYEIPPSAPVQLQLPLGLSAECEAFIAGMKVGYTRIDDYRLSDHVIHKELRKYLAAQQQELPL